MSDLRRAIVTGATSGIGAAAVKALVTSGRQVLAVARRADRLESLAEETGAEVLVADVRDTATLSGAIEAFMPDILINNAGVGHGITGIDRLDPELLQEAFDIKEIRYL